MNIEAVNEKLDTALTFYMEQDHEAMMAAVFGEDGAGLEDDELEEGEVDGDVTGVLDEAEFTRLAAEAAQAATDYIWKRGGMPAVWRSGGWAQKVRLATRNAIQRYFDMFSRALAAQGQAGPRFTGLPEENEPAAEPAAEPAPDAQAEDYTGTGGTPPPDHSPMGDPEEGGDGGVDNYSHEQEALLSYVMDLVDDCAGTMGLSHDDVMGGLEALAQEMADAGEIPPMPDIETASPEAISAWPLAAKTAGMAGRLAEYMKAKMA